VAVERCELSVGLRSFAQAAPSTWQPVLDRAERLDAAGVDRLVVSDHVVFGEDLGAYGDPAVGGTTGGRQPTGPDGEWLEPLTVLSFVAARTSQIRLGTNILLAALRRPVVLAKTLATLDVLSGGRVDLGVGVGWQREEYDAAGLDFDERGRLLDDTLETCRSLWSGDPVPLADDAASSVQARPTPVRGVDLPVWVSGTVNGPVARRLARFGSGWIPWGDAAADLPNAVPAMRERVERAGGDPETFGVVGVVPVVDVDGVPAAAATLAGVEDLVAAGVTDVRVSWPVAPDPDVDRSQLDTLVAEFHRRLG
jgi:probable F420-dependent oxidoreductase